MSLINFVYAEMKKLGLIESQNEFSEIFLGKSKRYYSFLLATRREPPLHVLVSLGIRLERLAEQLDVHQQWKGEHLKVMAGEIRREADRRSLLTIPCRRHSSPPVSMNACPLCQ